MVTVVIGGNLIDLMSAKITWKGRKRQTETPTHSYRQRQTLKGLFVLKGKLQGNTEVTFCHFLPSTCCPTVVSCHRDFYSHRIKPPSEVISFQGGCLQTFCQNILLWTITLLNTHKDDTLSPHARLTTFVFLFCICSVKSRLPISFFFFVLIFLISLFRVDWVHTLFQHHLALHLHSDTLSSPGSFLAQPSYWAAPLEQMGLRAKAVHWLLPFLYFYIQHAGIEIVPCHA